MKKIVLFFAPLFLTGILSAQITVTNATFPVTGDTLRAATDLTPSGIDITAAGGPYDWDFTSLNVGTQTEAIFKDASEGSVFDDLPSATHVALDDNFGGETYFRITADEVQLLAANGNDPIGFGISALFRFDPPIVQRRAPMTFPQNNMTESNLSIGLAWSDLPPILTDSLPLPITPDSIRVRIVNNRNDFVDAYGTLAIPGGSYEVLREKRTTFTETLVEAKVPIFGWQDVTDILAANFDGLGMDTTYMYEYYSNTEKEPIAVVTVDVDDNATSVTFKDNGILSADDEILAPIPTVEILPNPVSSSANFAFNNFKKGNYFLNIYGAYGHLISQKKINIPDGHVELIDLSRLPSANYFFLLKNEFGEHITSGILVKI